LGLDIRVLPLNIALSFFSTCMRWLVCQLSHRITTEKDERAFMLPGFLVVEFLQVLLYVTARIRLNTSEFVITLAWKEFGSMLRNIGATRVTWHRFMRMLGRDQVFEHPFATRRSTERVVAIAYAMAEMLGIMVMAGVAVMEIALFWKDPTVVCAVARCGNEHQGELLALFAVVFTRECSFCLENADCCLVLSRTTRELFTMNTSEANPR
jgi:hypothetical protein